MRAARMLLTVALGAVLCLGGCTSDFKEQNALLTDENESLRSQLSDRNAALGESQSDIRDLNNEVARLRRSNQELERPVANQPASTGFENIPGVTAEYSGGEVTISVASDVLFDSGEASLKRVAKDSLQQVAAVLRASYGARPVRIEGYTDTDPIKKSGHKSNYHLGFERAYSDRDFLVSTGVPAERISLASFGPDRPRSSKSDSRRVEIVVLAQ